MSGTAFENEALLGGVAKVLGLPDVAALGELRPSTLWNRTQRELLEAARLLGLAKVSRLNKEALLARVWEALEQVGAFGAAAARDGNGTHNGNGRGARAELAHTVTASDAATAEMERPEDSDSDDPEQTPPAVGHKFEVGAP